MPVVRSTMSRKDAEKFIKKSKQSYKMELLADIPRERRSASTRRAISRTCAQGPISRPPAR